jgi:UDP-N-acetylglucosamine--dolichyl-phosphate N-acetylglucosaminephosphotransferase
MRIIMLGSILVSEVAVAFVLTLLITPYINRFLTTRGYTSKDVHKTEPTEVPTFGGIAPVIAIFASLLIPIFFFDLLNILQLIAILFTISLITLIGIFDDLKAISQLKKIIFCAAASIPLYFVLHDTKLTLPFLGTLDIGWLFLILIAFTVVVSSNLTNMLAGFNGLETGLGIITSAALAIILTISGRVSFLTLLVPFTGALIGFIFYNWYPSKTFPGDTLTLTIGTVLACVALVSQLTFYLVILFIPYIIDFLMKATVKFQGRKLYGDTKIRADGTLEPPKYPAAAHIILKFTPMTEKQLVKALIIIEIVFALIAISLASLSFVFS